MPTDESRPIPATAAIISARTDSTILSPEEAPSRGAARRMPLWSLALGVGLVAGLISWVGGELTYNHFQIKDEVIYPPDYHKISGYHRQAVSAEIQGVALRVVERKRAAVSFGLLGLVLAVGLGAVGGFFARSSPNALRGVVGGGLAGAGAGGAISLVVTPIFFRFQNLESGLMILFLTHGAIFVGVGAASGLALGLGLGDRQATVRALFGGLLGAFVGTVALETINSVAFPLMRTLEPIPSEPTPRLVVYLCVAVFTAMVAGLAAGQPTTKPVPYPAV